MTSNRIPLGEVASYIKRGITPKYVDDGICILNQKCIRDGRVNIELSRRTNENARVAEEKYLQIGDVLINSTGTGTVGRTAPFLNPDGLEKTVVDTHITIVRPNPKKVNARFLAYALRQNEPTIVNIAKGATNQVELSAKDLALLLVPLLPRHEQDSIAEILTAYDDLIENNRQRMELLEESARLMYREWFVRLRFPGHEHTPITNDIPEGWEKVPTPEAIEINPRTKLSGEDEHWFVEMGELPINSMVIQSPCKRDGRGGSKFKNGDTLFARITPCLENGKTGYVQFMGDGEVGRGSTEFIVLRSHRVTPEFVYCLSRTYAFRGNAIKSMIGSSGRQRVQESCFEKFMVWVPTNAILIAFSENVEPLFRQIKVLHEQNQKLREARDLLLPRLMNGEIAA